MTRRGSGPALPKGRVPSQVGNSSVASESLRNLAIQVGEPEREYSGIRPAKAMRLLAVDLDGTLLDRNGIPHAEDVRAMRALQAAGGIITIATGRLYSGTQDAAQTLGIDGPLCCADGSHLVDSVTGNTHEHHGIDAARSRVLRETLREFDVPTFVFCENSIVHDSRGDAFLPYVQTWSRDVERTNRVWDHPVFAEGGQTAVVGLGTREQIESVHDRLRQEAKPNLQVATFGIERLGDLWGMIVRVDSVSKGTGIAWLARHHGVALSEIAVVGDWLNDVPMFALAGRSYAMGQAPAQVRAHATDLLEETSAHGGGIARVVRDLFKVKF
jgi:Cof subfamily protein (haloacid dehalogenase superfamily)